jgi:hypothetical protein
MSEHESSISDEFLSVPSHMKNRGWQLGMLFAVPSFIAAVIVFQFLREWQVIVMLMIALFAPFAAAYTGYRLGARDATTRGST